MQARFNWNVALGVVYFGGALFQMFILSANHTQKDAADILLILGSIAGILLSAFHFGRAFSTVSHAGGDGSRRG